LQCFAKPLLLRWYKDIAITGGYDFAHLPGVKVDPENADDHVGNAFLFETPAHLNVRIHVVSLSPDEHS
jgi:hypothetical protein